MPFRPKVLPWIPAVYRKRHRTNSIGTITHGTRADSYMTNKKDKKQKAQKNSALGPTKKARRYKSMNRLELLEFYARLDMERPADPS